MGPYIPPEYPQYTGPPPPPIYPTQPGMLLLAVAVIVLFVIVAREFAARSFGERIVDDLTIRWAPAEALELSVESDAEILTFGPDEGRPSRHRIQY